MVYPVDLTSALTGATINQLQHWRSSRLLDAEHRDGRLILYSFRDLVALRTFVKLRAKAPLQQIRKALDSLKDMNLTEHPSTYHLQADGNSIVLVDQDGAVDLVARPGQTTLATLEDIYAPFETRDGRQVVDFRHPRPLLEIMEGRMWGLPTIRNTRVVYDSVASLVGPGVTPEQVPLHYPSVPVAAVYDAMDFDAEVQSVRRRRAA